MDTTNETENIEISRGLLLLMAVAISASAANLYYNQPLLPLIGQSLGLDKGTLGLIPSATQIGYAAAIFFVSPLGDTMDRKQLIRYLSISLALGSLALAIVPSTWAIIAATFIIGVSANITQQILPLASSLATPEKKGQVIGTLMSGLTIGILLSRTLSGAIAEHMGWRSVFVVAAGIAVIIGILLQIYLPSRKPTAQLSYPKLLLSMFTLFKNHPLLREAAITGGLWFAAFNALWATLAIHVSGEPFSYSVQQIGLFGTVGLAGIIGAKISGRLVDSFGPNRIITIALLLIVSGFTVMASWGNSLAGLIVGIILVDIGVFGAQIPRGVIINVCGTAGNQPAADHVPPTTANSALITLTRAVGGKSLDDGIRVVGINPGDMENERGTMFLRRYAQKKLGDADRWREMLSDLPGGQAGTSKDMANVMVFLASPKASYVNGVVLSIDGGLSARQAVI